MNAALSNPIKRARQLLLLATDPAVGEAEARTAALIACRLIRSNHLAICVDGENYKDDEEIYETGYQAGRVAEKRAAAEAVKEKSSTRSDARSEGRHKIWAKFNGRCRYCKNRWAVGDEIMWAPVLGATCFDCAERGCPE